MARRRSHPPRARKGRNADSETPQQQDVAVVVSQPDSVAELVRETAPPAPVDELAARECDVCVTARRGGELIAAPQQEQLINMGRFNAGVVGVAPTDRARTFLRDWIAATEAMGNDQLALNHLVNPGSEQREPGHYTGPDGLSVHVVPCAIYNFYYFPEDPGPAKILHFKNQLRGFYAR